MKKTNLAKKRPLNEKKEKEKSTIKNQKKKPRYKPKKLRKKMTIIKRALKRMPNRRRILVKNIN